MSDKTLERQLKLGANDTLTVRIYMDDRSGVFNAVKATCKAIVNCGFTVPQFVEIGTGEGSATTKKLKCDITFSPRTPAEAKQVLLALNAVEGVQLGKVSNPTFLRHLGGKIEIVPKYEINNQQDLGHAYTPFVSLICMHLFENPDDAWVLTMKGNMVLIASDGTRSLSNGDIGFAGQPVLEGKACLFKKWGDVNAIPLTFDTKNTELFIQTAKILAKNFGGINLEDIESPRCWDIEKRLQEELDIPVFHDDQHGTAIAVVAGTMNACRVVKKRMSNLRVVVSGVGAAGMACCRLLIAAGVKNIQAFKKEGPIYPGREDMNDQEKWLAENSKSWHKDPQKLTLADGLKGADMFLGLSGPNLLQPEDLKVMRRDSIVFALANPVAEVDPDGARKYARIIGTGGNQHENQINNALVFPGFFRGALDARVRDITIELKLAAAKALAAVIPPKDLRTFNIIPDAFDARAHKAVADAVRNTAYATGKARRLTGGTTS